jgi:hypothetical protein
MMRPLLPATLLLVMLCSFPATAQEKFMEDFSVSLSFGARSVARTPQVSSYLNFMNYISVDDPYFVAYQYFNLTGRFNFRGKWQAEAILNYDDVYLSYFLQAQRMLTDKLGINMGIFSLSQYMSGYEEFYKNQDPGLVDRVNQRYGNIRDLGIMLGPAYRIRGRMGFVDARLNAGFSSTQPFSASFLLSSQGSNLRQLVAYKTKFSFSPFVSPELTAGIHLFRGKKSTLGIQGRFLWYSSRPSVPYQRTAYTWTLDNAASQSIHPEKTPYRRMEYDVGLFLYYH